MGRQDDPRLGREEVVYSVLIGFTRHLVLESGNDMLTACRGVKISVKDVVGVRARKIYCGRCQKYLNL